MTELIENKYDMLVAQKEYYINLGQFYRGYARRHYTLRDPWRKVKYRFRMWRSDYYFYRADRALRFMRHT